MWSACSMLVSGIDTWPPTGSARPSAIGSIVPAVVMAIDNSGKRKVRGFIVYPIGRRAAQPVYSGGALNFVIDAERYTSASIERKDFGGKPNQNERVVLTTILVAGECDLRRINGGCRVKLTLPRSGSHFVGRFEVAASITRRVDPLTAVEIDRLKPVVIQRGQSRLRCPAYFRPRFCAVNSVRLWPRVRHRRPGRCCDDTVSKATNVSAGAGSGLAAGAKGIRTLGPTLFLWWVGQTEGT
jgi:hypothetical protein